MPINLFKSKKYSIQKGNTIRKSEPIHGIQTRKDLHSKGGDHEASIVDISTVSNWVKESAVQKSNGAGSTLRAVLGGSNEPRQATLVNSIDVQSNVASEEGFGEGRDDSVVTTGQDSEPPRRQTLYLLIGQQDTSSRYFTQRYVRVPASIIPDSAARLSGSSDNSSPVSIPELDPQAFELYQIWLRAETIHFRCSGAYSSPAIDFGYMWQVCWPLINAHILGCAIDAPEFCDRVMDLIQEKLRNAPAADVDTINHIFSENERDISDVLRRFVVNRYIDAGIEAGIADLQIPSLPPLFVYALLDAALRRLSSGDTVSQTSDCEYHTHEASGTCYKLSVQPNVVTREKKLEAAREISRKDSEEVVKNVEINGVRTTDWEERRADANLALMKQRGWRRVGFRRLDEQPPLETATMRSAGADAIERNHELPKPTLKNQAGTDTSVENPFGTTKVNGAMDDVLCKAPSREVPPPPAFTGLATIAAYDMNPPDILPDYKAHATSSNTDTTTSTSTVPSGSTLTPSSRSSQSVPDLELRQQIEMTLELEKQLACPGAFPLSRNGSNESVVPQNH
jgi:hypothetical protein